MLLTKNLLQLHDSGVCTDAVNSLRLLEIQALLEHLAVGAIGIVLVSHGCNSSLMSVRKKTIGGAGVEQAMRSRAG